MSYSLLTKFALRALILAPIAVACSTPPTKQYSGPWLRPSPALKERIDSCARRLPWTHGLERVELIRSFATIGEPAFPALLELCQDPRPDVAGAALAALGASGDKRLVTILLELPWPSEERFDLRLERARALMRLGDRSMVPHLIVGLQHEKLIIRANCAKVLQNETGNRFGYVPGESPDARAVAVERWNEWWVACSTPVEELARVDVGS